MKAAVKTTSAKSVSPVLAGPTKVARASAFPYAPASGLRKRAAVSSHPTSSSASCKSRFGDNLDFRSLRRTLESPLVDIGQCLSVLDQLGDGLLGQGPKQPVYRPKPKSRSAPLGSSFFRPKSSGPPPAQVSSAPATDLKGKAPLVHPSFRPKLVFKAKVGSGPVPCDLGASSSSLDSSSLPPASRAPMSPWPDSSLPNSDGSSLEIASPEPPSGPGSPVSCASCLAPAPSMLPPLASPVVFPLACLQHLFSPLEAPLAGSLRL
jgi:hypothetical protein